MLYGVWCMTYVILRARIALRACVTETTIPYRNVLLYRALNLKPRVSWETAAAASPDVQAKAAGAVLCVEGAGDADVKKENSDRGSQCATLARDRGGIGNERRDGR